MVSLCEPGWPGIHYVDKHGLAFICLPASASQELESRVHNTWLNLEQTDTFIHLCVYVPASAYVHRVHVCVLGGQSVLDPLELELQSVVSLVLYVGPGIPARAVPIINC